MSRSGWSFGPTVSQRKPSRTASFRTSNPSCLGVERLRPILVEHEHVHVGEAADHRSSFGCGSWVTVARPRSAVLLPDCSPSGCGRVHIRTTQPGIGGTPAARRLVAIRARRLSDELAEPRAERAEAREADEEADLGDGQVRGPQQGLRALDPAPGEVGARRLAVGRRERAREVESGVAGLARPSRRGRAAPRSRDR